MSNLVILLWFAGVVRGVYFDVPDLVWAVVDALRGERASE